MHRYPYKRGVNEKRRLVINLGCSDTGYPSSGSKWPAAEESISDRLSNRERSSCQFQSCRDISAGFAERGYIEGQNIAIEYRYTEGKPDRTALNQPHGGRLVRETQEVSGLPF